MFDQMSKRQLQTATQSAGLATRIRADIIAGTIPFGTRLTLGQLEKLYDAGQMPVREALRQLQGEGLIELSPNKGARVRQVDHTFVRNLFDVRIAIEAILTRRAAEQIAPEQLARVEEAARDYEAADEANWVTALESNRRFHAQIYEVANNNEAVEILHRNDQLVSALWHRHGGPPHKATSAPDHSQILAALRYGDADSASCFAMAHAARAKFDLLSRMQAT
jgi:DNA-binding GntR family transcriptional regulator